MFSSNLHVARRSFLIGLAFSALGLDVVAQPSNASSVSGRNYIVAVVDAIPITNHEVTRRASQMRAQMTQQGLTAAPTATLMREALERLIDEKALLQYAKELGLDSDMTASDESRTTRASANAVSVSQQEQRDQQTLQRLVERNVPGRIKVSDTEIDQGIRERQASQTINPEIELAHILIAVPESANPTQVAALQSKAQAVLARLQSGANFAEVAKEVSDSVERDRGGLMGMRPSDRYPSLFVEATQSLRVGDLSAVLRSGAGFHILKLVSKRNLTSLTVTETRVRHILLRPNSQLSQAAARAQLAEDRRQIESGKADFAKLAQDHSQDASASNGGDLGWVGPGMFVPEFEKVMNMLAVGQLSDPVVSRFGVHLIQVLARRDAALTEREMRDIVRSNLREKKFEEAYQQWVQEVRGRAYVEYRDPPQ